MDKPLSKYPIPKQIYELYLQQATGCLYVSDGLLWIRKGMICSTHSKSTRKEYWSIAVDLKFTDRPSVELALATAQNDPKDSGLFLMDRGLISAAQLTEIRKTAIMQDVAGFCHGMERGRFAADESPSEEFFQVPVSPFSALLYAFEYYSTPRQIDLLKESLSDEILLPSSNLKYMLPAMELPETLNVALSQWTTPRTLSDFGAVMGIAPRKCHALVEVLLMVQALERRPRPKKMGETGPKEPMPEAGKPVSEKASQTASRIRSSSGDEKTKGRKEIPTPNKPLPRKENAPKAVAEPPVRKASSSQQQTKKSGTITPEWQKRIQEMEGFLRTIETNNPMKILGISEEARVEDAKKAYAQLARRWHPDRLGGTPLESKTAECAKLFSAIGNAYKVLTDPKQREAFLKIKDDPILKGDMKKAEQKNRAAAETEKAKIMYAKGDYKAVIAAARRSLAIFKQDPFVLALLGWAIFLLDRKSPKNQQEALKYLGHAIKLDPGSDMAHFYKGMTHIQANEVREGLHHLRMTLELNPHHAEAKRELRRIE